MRLNTEDEPNGSGETIQPKNPLVRASIFDRPRGSLFSSITRSEHANFDQIMGTSWRMLTPLRIIIPAALLVTVAICKK